MKACLVTIKASYNIWTSRNLKPNLKTYPLGFFFVPSHLTMMLYVHLIHINQRMWILVLFVASITLYDMLIKKERFPYILLILVCQSQIESGCKKGSYVICHNGNHGSFVLHLVVLYARCNSLTRLATWYIHRFS